MDEKSIMKYLLKNSCKLQIGTIQNAICINGCTFFLSFGFKLYVINIYKIKIILVVVL